jgi:hypothetical protein
MLTSAIKEGIESHEILRQVVLVRRDARAELGQVRITVAGLQITENLIIGFVFLDD